MNTEKIGSFYSSEFVTPDIYNKFGAIKAWWFIRPEVVAVCELLRIRFQKPVIINNWKVGGSYDLRGFRPSNSTVGAENSQHKLGAAADVSIEDYTADEIREHILQYKAIFMEKGLTTLEDAKFAPTWCHFDIRWTGMNEILIVKPM